MLPSGGGGRLDAQIWQEFVGEREELQTRALAIRTGPARLPSEVNAAQSAIGILAGRPGGQGFLVPLEVRQAIEGLAMESAIAHYSARGWSVENVSRTEPYDLRCVSDAGELHVEVKGTTSLGDRVLLTPGEVRHAREKHPAVALFIVSGIEILVGDGTGPTATGGTVTVVEPWDVAEGELIPLGYEYRLPAR